MPKVVKLEGSADEYEVVNPVSNVVHAKKTTEKKAKAQKRILDSAAAAEAAVPKAEPVAKAEPAPEMKMEKGAKKTHKWIVHIKDFAEKHSITYSQALKHADLKKDYVHVEKAPRSPRIKKEKVMVGGGVIDQIPNQAVIAIAANAHQMSPNELAPQLESLAAAKKVRKPRAKKEVKA
jgi:hypothetical protein